MLWQRFLWVFCQLESLKICKRLKDVHEALRSLPITLEDTYARILRNLGKIYSQEVIIALQWLAFSSRPLRIEELAEAAIINPQADQPFDQEDRFSDSGTYSRYCLPWSPSP